MPANPTGRSSKPSLRPKTRRAALWHNDTKQTRTMQAATNVYIHAKPDVRLSRLADSYWRQRSRLLLCILPWLITARVNAVCLAEPAFGAHWIPAGMLQLEGEELTNLEKSICAYLNSSFGWISMIAVASPKKLSRPMLSLNAMRRLPVPKLTPDQAAAIAEVFDELADTVLEPLRYAATDKARIRLDDAVADALGGRPRDRRDGEA